MRTGPTHVVGGQRLRPRWQQEVQPRATVAAGREMGFGEELVTEWTRQRRCSYVRLPDQEGHWVQGWEPAARSEGWGSGLHCDVQSAGPQNQLTLNHILHHHQCLEGRGLEEDSSPTGPQDHTREGTGPHQSPCGRYRPPPAPVPSPRREGTGPHHTSFEDEKTGLCQRHGPVFLLTEAGTRSRRRDGSSLALPTLAAARTAPAPPPLGTVRISSPGRRPPLALLLDFNQRQSVFFLLSHQRGETNARIPWAFEEVWPHALE